MKRCYGCTFLSDSAKLREHENVNQLLSVVMIKFQSYLVNNPNNNKKNTAITENYTSTIPITTSMTTLF